MTRHDRGGGREAIWGINANDRRWFQALTLLGGNVGSIAVIVLVLKHRSGEQTADALALNLLLSIGASFVAAGFAAWSLVQIKELTMAIADWIREATEKRRQRILEQGRAEGRDEGRDEGRAEGYREGYDDAQQGKPRRVPNDKPASEC